MKCPFFAEFGKWIECPHLQKDDGECCEKPGSRKSWCGDMIGKAMLAHKTWIGNDY